MATTTEANPAAPERADAGTWGIEPVPRSLRTLGALDLAALWGNLGISLLLPVVGALLVPGLSLPQAVLAIVVGAVIGNVMLGIAGRIGAEVGVPAMVLYRAPLGIRGSYVATAFNIAQNIGWGAFELFIIAAAATAAGEAVFGSRTRALWVVAFGVICVAMAVGGPVAVVRRWIRRVAVWAVVASGVYLTWYLVSDLDARALWARPGEGGWPSFWQGVDLVVAMPVSWIPLIADYTRFARGGREAFVGSAAGYFVAHVWFYLLGVLLVLGRGADPSDPAGFVAATLAIPAGVVALLILVVAETDEAFANINSTAVSLQNFVPKVARRLLVVVVGAVCIGLALLVDLVQYENFLLLLGALFVPLFGVLVADYYVLRRSHYEPAELYRRGGRYWYVAGVNWPLVGAWLAGFLAYNWINPGTVSWWVEAMGTLLHGWLHLPATCVDGACAAPYTWLGASLASFAVAAVVASLAGIAARRAR